MSEKDPTPVENREGEAATVAPTEDLGPVPAQTSEATTVGVEAVANSTHDKEVTLKVVSPFWTTSLTVTTEDGGTLTVDRSGTTVPRSDLEAILDASRKTGVILTEVSD